MAPRATCAADGWRSPPVLQQIPISDPLSARCRAGSCLRRPHRLVVAKVRACWGTALPKTDSGWSPAMALLRTIVCLISLLVTLPAMAQIRGEPPLTVADRALELTTLEIGRAHV